MGCRGNGGSSSWLTRNFFRASASVRQFLMSRTCYVSGTDTSQSSYNDALNLHRPSVISLLLWETCNSGGVLYSKKLKLWIEVSTVALVEAEKRM